MYANIHYAYSVAKGHFGAARPRSADEDANNDVLRGEFFCDKAFVFVEFKPASIVTPALYDDRQFYEYAYLELMYGRVKSERTRACYASYEAADRASNKRQYCLRDLIREQDADDMEEFFAEAAKRRRKR